MHSLRYYQDDAVNAFIRQLNNTSTNPLIELPTGTGKSLVQADICFRIQKHARDNNRRVRRILCVTHVKELVGQNEAEMRGHWPDADTGILSAGIGRRDTRNSIIFAGIQTAVNMAWALSPIDLVLVDEAHLLPHGSMGMYHKLIAELRRHNPDLRIGGQSATPYRLSSGRLDEGKDRIFDNICYRYDMQRAVQDGYLAPLISKKTALTLDGEGVKIKGGEFNEADLQAAMDKEELVKRAVGEIIEFGHDRKAWMAFCSGIDHAEHVAEELQRQGVRAGCISSRTDKGEREEIIEQFRRGELQCITNANVLTTGFNVKSVDLIAHLRPTLSTGLYVQIMGRGTRPVYADGYELTELGHPAHSPEVFKGECERRKDAIAASSKRNCLILDFAGNVRRHGPVDMVDPPKRGQKKAGVKVESSMTRECPECRSLVHISKRVCDDCGHEFPGREPDHSSSADGEAAVMSSEIVDKWHDVKRVIYGVQKSKKGGPDMLKIAYWCGITPHNFFCCPLHTGYAGDRSREWLEAMGMSTEGMDKLPTAEECHAQLAKVTAIKIKPDGQYTKVTHWFVEAESEIVDDRGRKYDATINQD